MIINHYLFIAAMMLSGDEDPISEYLHPSLRCCLVEIDDLCRIADGKLNSPQVIATTIFAWRNANVGVKPYGKQYATR